MNKMSWIVGGVGGGLIVFYYIFLSRGKGERNNKNTHTHGACTAGLRRRATVTTWQRCFTTPHVTTGRLHKKRNNNNNSNNKRARRSRRRAWLARRRRRLHSVYTHAHPPDEMCFFFRQTLNARFKRGGDVLRTRRIRWRPPPQNY